MAVPFYIPTNKAQGSNFSTSWPTLVIFFSFLFFFYSSHPNACGVICISLMFSLISHFYPNVQRNNIKVFRLYLWVFLHKSPFILFFFFFSFFLNLFFGLHWVFVAVRRLPLVVASRGYSSLRCAGFSLRWLLLLRSMVSRHTGFSSCSMWAQ